MAWSISVVKIDEIQKHPNADLLEIAIVEGIPVIIKKEEYKAGDLAVYIPVDSVVPDTEDYEFLRGHLRIKAKKLRGVFSCGLLVQSKPEWVLGQDVQAELGIEKYDPETIEENKCKIRGDAESAPFVISKYDIDNARKYSRLMVVGEPYVATEKIHGANSRFVWYNDRIWCGSRTQWKKESNNDLWWRIANNYNLTEKLKKIPNLILYGETYGQVQDIKYGAVKQNDVWFAAFDLYNLNNSAFLNYKDFVTAMKDLDIPMVPELFVGKWSLDSMTLCKELAEGKTTINNSGVVREGCVIRPVIERWDHHIGRIIIKLHGEGFLLRREK